MKCGAVLFRIVKPPATARYGGWHGYPLAHMPRMARAVPCLRTARFIAFVPFGEHDLRLPLCDVCANRRRDEVWASRRAVVTLQPIPTE